MSAIVAGELRVTEVLGALSLATDLGSGVPFEKGLRTCVVAAVLSDGLALGLEDQRAACYAALLRSLGCTATSPEFSALFDDDIAVQRELKTIDFGDADVFAAQLGRFGSWSGAQRASELGERFVNVLPERGPPRRSRSSPISPPPTTSARTAAAITAERALRSSRATSDCWPPPMSSAR